MEALSLSTDEFIATQYALAKGTDMFDVTSRPKYRTCSHTTQPLDYLSQIPEIVTEANTRHSGAPKQGWPCCLSPTLTATFDYASIVFVRIYPEEKVISVLLAARSASSDCESL